MADPLRDAVEQVLDGTESDLPAPFSDQQHARVNLRAIYHALGGDAPALDTVAQAAHFAMSSPDPNGALNNLERLAASAEAAEQLRQARTELLSVAITVFSHSQYLSEILVREPQLLQWLTAPAILNAARSKNDYFDEVRPSQAKTANAAELKDFLCQLKRREYLRIGTRDFLRLASVEETTREISDLAESLIAAAAQIAWEQTVARYGEPIGEGGSQAGQVCGMCVLGMGKLGGRELNFASDIDLIFIYDAEGETSGKLPDGRKTAPQTNHVFFTRMGETLVKFLSERGPEGNLFRVDMRLRPEGNTGPLARSLESFSNYLAQQARDWERLAYLKARVLFGPKSLANRIYQFTESFVFSETAPERIIREVERLKFMIDREVIVSDEYQREVKRGYGGIREIEFVVATMQIVYGRVHRALHVRNFFVGVDRLQQVRLLTPEEARMYFKSYDFLRMVEHRLQMAHERQTHTIPDDAAELEILARRCGFASSEDFQATYLEITSQVHARFLQFFEQDVTRIDRETQDAIIILNRDSPEPDAIAALARFGLTDPGALPLIRDLAFGTREIFITAEGQRSFEQMLPSLLRLIPQSPNPAQVLPLLHSFVLTVKGITYYYELIAEHPDILSLIVSLFGTSEYYARAMTVHPEFFDALISSQVLYENQTKETVLQRLNTAVRSRRQLDRRLVMFRRAATFENLLSALRYILKLRSLSEVLEELAVTADACIDVGVYLASQRIAERTAPSDAKASAVLTDSIHNLLKSNLLVVALGKYGGRELGFFGDADVVFVYDDNASMVTELGEPLSAQAFYQSAADALGHVLGDQIEEGRVMIIDARLRPHGKNSPIATASSVYVSYLARESDVWELQSFTRARLVLGPVEIFDTLLAASRERAASLSQEHAAREIRTMRSRLEEAQSNGLDTKRGPGGLVDIEFALQYLELTRNVPPGCTTTNYFEMLECLNHNSALPPVVASQMNDGYQFLRNLECAVRLITGKSDSAIPENPIQRLAVAKMLAMTNPETLLSEVGACMQRNRDAFNRILGQ